MASGDPGDPSCRQDGGEEPLSRIAQALDETLAKKSQVLASMRMRHDAVEADMQQLDDQLQLAKLALTDLVENLATKRQIPEIPDILKTPEIPKGTPKGTPKGETRTEVAHPELPHLPHALASEEASPAASPQGKWAFATSAAANIGPAPTTNAANSATKADLARRNPTETAKTAETRGGSLAGRLRSEVDDDELPDTSNGLLAFLQAMCKKMVLEERSKAAKSFECTMCLVIFVNAIVQGVEAELSLTSDTLYWAVPVEYGFLTMYIIELIIRFIAKGRGCLWDPFFGYDMTLVVLTFARLFFEIVDPSMAFAFQMVKVLRTIRLLRIVHTFRTMRRMRVVWRLMKGVVSSAESMAAILGMLALVMYIFGVVGLEIISKDVALRDDATTGPVVRENFSSLYVTLISLSQFATMDSIAAIYAPLLKKKEVLSVYFTLLVVFVSLSMMNLVTAVIVEGAQDHARQDREEEQRIQVAKSRDVLAEVNKLFRQLDQDDNMIICLEEVQRAEREELMQVPQELLDKASVESITELFHSLDVDHSGLLTREEFEDGLLKILLSEVPLGSLQMMKMVRLLRDAVHKLDKKFENLMVDVKSLLAHAPKCLPREPQDPKP